MGGCSPGSRYSQMYTCQPSIKVGNITLLFTSVAGAQPRWAKSPLVTSVAGGPTHTSCCKCGQSREPSRHLLHISRLTTQLCLLLTRLHRTVSFGKRPDRTVDSTVFRCF